MAKLKQQQLQKLNIQIHLEYLMDYISTNIYKIWISRKNKIIFIRNIIFNKNIFFTNHKNKPSIPSNKFSILVENLSLFDQIVENLENLEKTALLEENESNSKEIRIELEILLSSDNKDKEDPPNKELVEIIETIFITPSEILIEILNTILIIQYLSIQNNGNLFNQKRKIQEIISDTNLKIYLNYQSEEENNSDRFRTFIQQ